MDTYSSGMYTYGFVSFVVSATGAVALQAVSAAILARSSSFSIVIFFLGDGHQMQSVNVCEDAVAVNMRGTTRPKKSWKVVKCGEGILIFSWIDFKKTE
jgi:hypothetical protein